MILDEQTTNPAGDAPAADNAGETPAVDASTDAEAEAPARATIYSKPVCHFCQAAKAFFKDNEITYNDINVAEDADARQEMIEMTGQMGVPVIRIGDDVIIGFDEAKVKELLGV